jgi:hypothetical protein
MSFSSLPQNNQRRRRANPPLESPRQLALIAAVVWLIGFLFHPIAVLAPIGIALLLVAGAAYLVRPKKRTMYWRGRELELDGEPGPMDRLYRSVFKS